MIAIPPVTRSREPSRRRVPGRFAWASVGVLVLAGGCARGPSPSFLSPDPAATASSPASASPVLPGVDGLLVAIGGPLQITTADGDLVSFDGRLEPSIEVAAGAGNIVVIDHQFNAWRAPDPGPGSRAWLALVLPTDGRGERPFIALDPRGSTLALATGELQGDGFDLILIEPATGASRSIPVAGGLNGPPVWLGPGALAVNLIGAGQHAGFSVIDTTTGTATTLPTFGSLLAASANGLLVALDDARTGDVLVGAESDMTDAGIARMTRLRGPPGFAPDRVALNGAGTRLAIVRRSEAAVTLEILAVVDGRWTNGSTITSPGDAVLSIAWLR